jgi:hypothetical protein
VLQYDTNVLDDLAAITLWKGEMNGDGEEGYICRPGVQEGGRVH